MKKSVLVVLVVLLSAIGCRRDDLDDLATEDPVPTAYTLEHPWYFPPPQLPPDNPLTVEGIELGRKLYYDPVLSTNGPFQGMACASCHDQERAFSVATPGTSVLPHMNLAWSINFLWNGKVSGTLEDIMRFEVEEFFQVDLQVLQQHPEYPALFRKAFGTDQISSQLLQKALAQWFRRLVTAQSRFDGYLQHEVQLSDQELSGMMIFLTETGDCFHCHGIPLMTDNEFHNIGLDTDHTGADVGRFAITGDPADMGRFKTPSLRNIALTAPYMHDGRFQTLEEVVEHYSSGVQHSATLDPIMTKPGTGITLGLTPMQKADLVAFLHTLTDDHFVDDPALSDPF